MTRGGPAAWLAAAVLAGCAAAPPTPPPSRPVRLVPPSFIEESIGRRKVSGVTMRIYNTGDIRTRGAAVSSMKSWSAKIRLDDPVFLVKHPTEGLILFDAGLSSQAAAEMGGSWLESFVVRFDSKPGQDAAGQLKADGVDLGDVRWVLLSHLHRDHTASIDAFPKATVVVSRREWEAQKAKWAEKPDKATLNPAAYEGKLRLRLLDFDGAPPYGAFDHAVDLFSDGTLVAVDLPGHTEGSMGAWVNLDGGPVLLAGDAAWVVDNFMDQALPNKRGYRNLGDYMHSIQMMRAMQEAVPRLVIFPGHDLTPRTLTNRADLPLVPFAPAKP